MDIKIVGAGPAGLISALYLNKAGYKPTIYEKQNEDEYESTPCGEGISLEKLRQLREETGFKSESYISKINKGFRLFFPNGKFFTVKRRMAILNRSEWLEDMIDFLEEKNIDIHFDRKIEQLVNLDYSYLIGADGPNSKIRKELDIDVDIQVASQYKMRLNEDMDYLRFYLDKRICKEGYGWIFPKDNVSNVGISSGFDDLDNFLEIYNINEEIISKESYPIGGNGTKFSNSSEDVLLTGDAAGLTNPLSGSGLVPIIKSSKFIVDHVNDKGNYGKSIKSSSINPKYWEERLGKFYTNNSTYESVGNILDGEVLGNLSISSKIRFLLKPFLWEYMKNNKKTVGKLFEASL